MSESTPPPESSEPATGPVLTPSPPPPAPQPPVYHAAPPQYAPAPDNNRLNKAAAWVGIVAGSVINFIAFALAPASILAPLESIQVRSVE